LDLLEQHGARLHRLGAKDQRVATAVRLLEAQPGLGPLPYEQLCQAADCSRSQLDRLIRKDLGMSPRAWQEQRTLAEAQSLLNRGEWDVGSIARHLRFSDSSHFAKWFRRLSGCAPRAWQEPA
jgi:AraC-like DNA-binding protein